MVFGIKEKGLFPSLALVTVIVIAFIISARPQIQASLDDQTSNGQLQTNPQLSLAAYTVFNQQNAYIVKNREGINELQTEDASTAINHALDMVASQGGRVLLTAGDYLINSTLKIHSNTILEGEAIDDVNNLGFGTRLIAAPDLVGSILSNANPSEGDSMITLQTLSFDGARSSKDLKNGSYGILFTKTNRCRIVDVVVYKCRDSGIVFEGNQGTVEAIMERISSRGNNNAGLYMKTQSDFHIYNSEFGSNQGEGILLSSCSSGSIIGTNVFLNLRTGILLYNTLNMRISNNRVNHNGYSGIEVTSNTQNRAEYNILTENICFNNGQQSTFQAGIKIGSIGATANNCIVYSNICYNERGEKTQDFGILEQNGALENLISQNICKNNNIEDLRLSQSSKEFSMIP